MRFFALTTVTAMVLLAGCATSPAPIYVTLEAPQSALATQPAQRAVLVGRVETGAVVGLRDVELGAAEHARGVVDGRVDRIPLVGKDSMKALHVREFRDLVAD